MLQVLIPEANILLRPLTGVPSFLIIGVWDGQHTHDL